MSSLAGALDDPRNQDAPMDPASDREEDEEMDDLFGNDEDVENYGANRRSQSPTTSQQDSERLASPERERRQAMEYEEDDAPPVDVAYEVTEAEVSFPNIPVPRSSDGDKWVIRTPNFVQVDSKPFHPDTYTGPEQEDEDFTAENVKERSMTIKLKVENTIRWRWTKDANGQERQQSNSRVIRWSDGSLSLRLGNELFDITKSIDTSAGQPRGLGASQPSQSQPQSQSQAASAKNQGLTYLVAQHKRSQVLQAEAVITGNMSLRPTSMQSETHRMLVKAVGQKHNKVARLKMTADPTVDPEREKLELAKQSNKKTRKRGEGDDGMGAGKSRRRFSKRTDWSDDEDEEFGNAFSGDEDGSSPRKAKRKDDDENKGYQEDDFLVADDSDEDAGEYRKKKRRRGDEDEDPLDKLDAKIEANQKDGESDDEKAMEVESEEEEEDVPVRRNTGSSRRRAVNFDEDED